MPAERRGAAEHRQGTAIEVEIEVPGARHHDVTVDARAEDGPETPVEDHDVAAGNEESHVIEDDEDACGCDQ